MLNGTDGYLSGRYISNSIHALSYGVFSIPIINAEKILGDFEFCLSIIDPLKVVGKFSSSNFTS